MDDAQKAAARDRAKDRLFEIILRLEDEAARLRADLAEQYRLLGMGIEREARLVARMARMVDLIRKLREPDWHLESIREFQRELTALESAALSDDSALRELIATEREACAALLDENAQQCGEESMMRLILETNAAAIRARKG